MRPPVALLAAAIAVLAGGRFPVTAAAPRAQGSAPLSADLAELEPFEQRVREYLVGGPP